MSTSRRGPRPRAGTPATERVELRLTLTELRAVQKLAREADSSVADMIRLALLDLAADAGEAPPVSLTQRLQAIVAGSNSEPA